MRIFTSLWRYFSHIATWRQEITNLWNHSGKVGIEPRTSCIPSQALYHYINPPICSFGIPYIFDEDYAIMPSHNSHYCIITLQISSYQCVRPLAGDDLPKSSIESIATWWEGRRNLIRVYKICNPTLFDLHFVVRSKGFSKILVPSETRPIPPRRSPQWYTLFYFTETNTRLTSLPNVVHNHFNVSKGWFFKSKDRHNT